MKLLIACSSLDLRTPLSATPAWWQLLKALYETGVELVVTAYHGTVPETLWWRSYPNPAKLEGDAYGAVRAATRRIRGGPPIHDSEADASESVSQKAVRFIAQSIIAPRWRGHLARILRAERGIDAVLLLSVPPNHLRGVARSTRASFALPVLFYDGDAPASLPNYLGFASGFGIYQGADVGEFDAVISNSKGAAEALQDLGARSIHTLYYAADPAIYGPLSVQQDIDILFYGHTPEYRDNWISAMLTVPSAALPEARFAVRGVQLGKPGDVEEIPYLSFSDLRGCIARSRINLVIARRPHASVYGSSTMRPFELAMMGACMVSNPILGVEEWFEPGRELIVVSSAEEAIDRYRFLLSHDSERRAIGAAARKRALAEHTYRHRATQLVQILKEYL